MASVPAYLGLFWGCLVVVVISIAIVLRNENAYFYLLRIRNSNPPPVQPSSIRTEESRCVLYDRPPHTGSTTMMITLQSCMKAKGYRIFATTHGKEAIRARLGSFLKDGNTRRAMSSGHLQINKSEADDMLQSCPNLFYITSTRPMPDRLFVWAKQMVANRTDVRFQNLLRKVKRSLISGEMFEMEKYFEKYPYVEAIAESERLTPHYVIRSSHFEDDAKPLLDALNCSGFLQSGNRHSILAKDWDEGQVRTISKQVVENLTELIRMGNRRNLFLERLALRNKRGLELARLF